MYLPSEKELAQWAHLRFWEAVHHDGWHTDPGYGPVKYQENVPNSPGLYLFALTDVSRNIPQLETLVAYVGKSRNVFKRQIGHEVRRLIQSEISPDLALELWFKSMPEQNIHDEEKRYIRLYNPPYNIIGRKRGL
jgi:excinuclease UvrABC nuclease subunit